MIKEVTQVNSNTGSYSGQDMTRHTNSEKQAQQGKAKKKLIKMNTTQTKTRKYPKKKHQKRPEREKLREEVCNRAGEV